jgi:hypothetical protein
VWLVMWLPRTVHRERRVHGRFLAIRVSHSVCRSTTGCSKHGSRCTLIHRGRADVLDPNAQDGTYERYLALWIWVWPLHGILVQRLQLARRRTIQQPLVRHGAVIPTASPLCLLALALSPRLLHQVHGAVVRLLRPRLQHLPSARLRVHPAGLMRCRTCSPRVEEEGGYRESLQSR